MNKAFIFVLVFMSIIGILAQDEAKEKKLSHEELVTNNRDYFYVVEIELQENKEIKVVQQGEYYYDANEHYIVNKIPMVTQGIAFSQKNLIVTPVTNAYPNQFKSVTVITNEGKRLNARYYGHFIDHEADIFEVIGEDIPTPELEEYDIRNEKFYYSLNLYQDEEKFYFSDGYHENITYQAFNKNEVYRGNSASGFSLLLSKTGKACGYSFASDSHEEGVPSCVLAKEEARFFTAEELALKNVEAKIAEDLSGTIYTITVNFRQNPMNEENAYGYSAYTGYTTSRVEDTTLELKTCGCLLDDQGTLIIPTEIPRKQVERIQSIVVSSGDNNYSAEFLGLYQDIGAVMVRCTDLATADTKVNSEYIPKRKELFFAISPNQGDIGSAKRTFVRWQSYLRGYKNKKFIDYYGQNEAVDVFLVNSDNEVIGIVTDHKKNEEDILSSSSGSYYYNEKRPFFFAEIKDMLAEPDSYFDSKAVPVEETVKTKIWLGVEVQTPQVPILEHLKATDATQYGKIGYLVNYVYDNSPAQKIGLKPLDILLSITPKDTGNEIFFSVGYYYGDYRYPDFNWTDLNFGNFFSTRKNQVIETLTKLEEKREVTLKYFRDGKLQYADITLEKAPDDFESAKKVHIESLGLTLKDLTYEVKQVLKMSATQKGAIVYKTSNGQPAMIAGLTMYEVISVVDGVAVQNAKHFKELVENAYNNGQYEITLLVNRLDKSRIVKLQFSE